MEDFLKRQKIRIEAAVTPEKFVGEADLNLFNGAGITDPKEVRWIARIKRNVRVNEITFIPGSHEYNQKKRAEVQRISQAREQGSEDLITVDAYELIRVHAMVMRDLRVNGIQPDGSCFFSRGTERAVEKVFQKVASLIDRYKDVKWEPDGTQVSLMKKYVEDLTPEYEKAFRVEDKMAVITKVLNLAHTGGAPIGIRSLISEEDIVAEEDRGDPGPNAKFYFARIYQFLTRLNNLGHQDPEDEML